MVNFILGAMFGGCVGVIIMAAIVVGRESE